LGDLLSNNTVYVAASTKYAYINVEYNARKIVSCSGDYALSGCIELGTQEGICLGELRELLGSTSTFEGKDDSQIPISPPSDAPEVKDVIVYARSLKKHGQTS